MSDDGSLYEPSHNHCRTCYQLAIYQLTVSERSHKAVGPGVLSRKSSAQVGEHHVTVWLPEGVAR